MELYKNYGGQTNGQVIVPVTDKEVIEYCLSNKDIAYAIWLECEKESIGVCSHPIYVKR